MGKTKSDRKPKAASPSNDSKNVKRVVKDESEEEVSSEDNAASSKATKDTPASRKRKPDSNKSEDSKKKSKSAKVSEPSDSESDAEVGSKGKIEVTKTQGMFAQRGKFFIHMKQKSAEDSSVIYDVHFPVEQIDEIVEGLKALQKDCANESELKQNAVLNGISTEHVKLSVQHDASKECFAVLMDSLKQRFKKKVTVSFPVKEIGEYISKIVDLKA